MSLDKKIGSDVRLFLARGMQCARAGDYLEAKGFWAMALQRDPDCEVAQLCLSLVNEYLDSPARTASRSKPNIPAIVASSGYDLSSFEKVREPTPSPSSTQPGAEPRDRWPGQFFERSSAKEPLSPKQTLTGHIFSQPDVPMGMGVPRDERHPEPTDFQSARKPTPTPERRTTPGSAPRYKAPTAPPPYKRQSRPDHRFPPAAASDLEQPESSRKLETEKTDSRESDAFLLDPWSSPASPLADVAEGDASKERRQNATTKPGFYIPGQARQEPPPHTPATPTEPSVGEERYRPRADQPGAAPLDHARPLPKAPAGDQGRMPVGVQPQQEAHKPVDPLADPFAVLRPGFVWPQPQEAAGSPARTGSRPQVQDMQRSVPAAIRTQPTEPASGLGFDVIGPVEDEVLVHDRRTRPVKYGQTDEAAAFQASLAEQIAPVDSGVIRFPLPEEELEPTISEVYRTAGRSIRRTVAPLEQEPRDTRSPHPRTPPPVEDATSLYEKALLHHSLGDFQASQELVEQVLSLDPRHVRARQLSEENQRQLTPGKQDPLASMDTVFHVSVKVDQLFLRKLDVKKGFVLSRVDGVCSIEDIIDLVHFSKEETLKLLAELFAEGIITT